MSPNGSASARARWRWSGRTTRNGRPRDLAGIDDGSCGLTVAGAARLGQTRYAASDMDRPGGSGTGEEADGDHSAAEHRRSASQRRGPGRRGGVRRAAEAATSTTPSCTRWNASRTRMKGDSNNAQTVPNGTPFGAYEDARHAVAGTGARPRRTWRAHLTTLSQKLAGLKEGTEDIAKAFRDTEARNAATGKEIERLLDWRRRRPLPAARPPTRTRPGGGRHGWRNLGAVRPRGDALRRTRRRSERSGGGGATSPPALTLAAGRAGRAIVRRPDRARVTERPHAGGLPGHARRLEGQRRGRVPGASGSRSASGIEDLITGREQTSAARWRGSRRDVRKAVASDPGPTGGRLRHQRVEPAQRHRTRRRPATARARRASSPRCARTTRATPASYADGAFRDKADDLEATMKVDGQAEGSQAGRPGGEHQVPPGQLVQGQPAGGEHGDVPRCPRPCIPSVRSWWWAKRRLRRIPEPPDRISDDFRPDGRVPSNARPNVSDIGGGGGFDTGGGADVGSKPPGIGADLTGGTDVQGRTVLPASNQRGSATAPPAAVLVRSTLRPPASGISGSGRRLQHRSGRCLLPKQHRRRLRRRGWRPRRGQPRQRRAGWRRRWVRWGALARAVVSGPAAVAWVLPASAAWAASPAWWVAATARCRR